MAINEFDDQALEEAVLIKEATGATVTAVGLRSDGIEEALRLAYARGADRLVVVEAGEIDAVRLADGGARVRGGVPPAGARPRADRRPDAVRRVRPDGALPRRRRSAGRRRTSSSESRSPTEPRASCRSTPVGGSRCSGLAAAGGRRRAVRELAAAVRRDGPAPPGDDRGEHRDARRQRRGARRGAEARLARSAGAPDSGDDARGRRRGGGREDRRGAARTGSSGGLMGDVLVYVESPVNDRLLAFARPLADAAGGDLVALVGEREPTGEDGLSAADVVLEVSHPALSPYLPEAHQAVLAAAIRERAPDLVVLENTTAGLDLGAAAAAATGLPFVGYCVELSRRGRRGASRSAASTAGSSTPPPARRCRRCSRSTPRPCTTSRRPPGAASAVQLAAAGRAGEPADDVRRTGRAPGRGRRPDEGRADRLRRPWHRGRREHRGRRGAGRRAGRRAGSVATGHRLGLAAQGAAGRKVGRDGATRSSTCRSGSRARRSMSRGCRGPS